jgi:hypothetical protein
MAQVYIPKEKRKMKAGNKLDPRARWGICLGPSPDGRSWVFHYRDNNKIGCSRDVYFHENLTYANWKRKQKQFMDDLYLGIGDKAVCGDPVTRIMQLPKEFPLHWPLSVVPEERVQDTWDNAFFPMSENHIPDAAQGESEEDGGQDQEIATADSDEEEDSNNEEEEEKGDVRDKDDEVFIGPPEGKIVSQWPGKGPHKTFGTGARYPQRARAAVKHYNPTANIVVPIANLEKGTAPEGMDGALDPTAGDIWLEGVTHLYMFNKNMPRGREWQHQQPLPPAMLPPEMMLCYFQMLSFNKNHRDNRI